jgi:hypothetical protein
MAEKRVWLGSSGPFLYDDTDTYEDGETYKGLRTEGEVEGSNINSIFTNPQGDLDIEALPIDVDIEDLYITLDFG